MKNNPRRLCKLRKDQIVTGDFCAIFGEFSRFEPQKPVITLPSILMIGARIEGHDLSAPDLVRLRQTIEFLYRHDIAFDTTEVHISNLEYGHDSAKLDGKDDWGLLMLCWVNKDLPFDNGRKNWLESALIKAGQTTWSEIFEKSGSNIIANFSDQQTCISNEDIPHDFYRELEPKGRHFTNMSVHYRIA